jgi:hypothetical protein
MSGTIPLRGARTPDGMLSHDVLLQVRFLDRSDDAALFAHVTDDDLMQVAPVDES